MAEETALLVWLSLAAYLGVGLLVAFTTIVFAVKRLEPGAGAMPLRVRLLVTPGLMALWPLVIIRLLGARAAEDRP